MMYMGPVGLHRIRSSLVNLVVIREIAARLRRGFSFPLIGLCDDPMDIALSQSRQRRSGCRVHIQFSLSPFAGVVASLVHPSVRPDPAGCSYHAAFIATRLAGGGLAVLALPVYLALWGAPSLIAALCFALLVSPLPIALFVSRTGRLGIGHLLSAGSLSSLVGIVASATGGVQSALLAWLVVVPVEAALSGSVSIVVAAAAIAATTVLAIVGADLAGLVAPAPAGIADWLWPLVGALPAALFAGMLAAQAAITARRAAESASAAGRRFATLAEAFGDPVLALRRNGNVVWAPAAAGAFAGCDSDQLAGDGLFARILVTDRPAYLRALDRAAETGAGVAEIRLRRGPGEASDATVWTEVRARRLPAEETSLAEAGAELVAMLTDIGSRKAQEAEVHRLLEQAERSSIAKGRFLANMSHELRTPLNAIIGFSEMLADETVSRLEPDQQREYAGLIRDSGRHLLDVVNDILDMSKIETGKFEIFPELFDIVGLVRKCAQMMEIQARRAGLRLEVDLPDNFPELNADRRACKQILLNLLSNAVKFSRPGGRVVVGLYREPQSVVLYVADEGIGIPRADLPRLGDPFVQLHTSYDRRYEGTGLGLSVVKGLAALHGGSVSIDSEIGRGTRVTVRIPARREGDIRPARQFADAGEPMRRSA